MFAMKGTARWELSEAVAAVAEVMFKYPLVTKQTGPEGQKVSKVLVQEAADIARAEVPNGVIVKIKLIERGTNWEYKIEVATNNGRRETHLWIDEDNGRINKRRTRDTRPGEGDNNRDVMDLWPNAVLDFVNALDVARDVDHALLHPVRDQPRVRAMGQNHRRRPGIFRRQPVLRQSDDGGRRLPSSG